ASLSPLPQVAGSSPPKLVVSMRISSRVKRTASSCRTASSSAVGTAIGMPGSSSGIGCPHRTRQAPTHEGALSRAQRCRACCAPLARELAIRRSALEVRAHEPLELLELRGLADEHVFGDRVALPGERDCLE